MDIKKDANLTENVNSNMALDDLRAKAEQLTSDLQNNDLVNAQKCINEINELNKKGLYEAIGDLTRGVNSAITDLSISSSNDSAENNKTRVDLNYVINLTHESAKKTLDMTECSMRNMRELNNDNDQQKELINNYLSANSSDKEITALLNELLSLHQKSEGYINQVNKNIAEIIMAQTFQDIASQSITKAIKVVKQVKSSLVSSTEYANHLASLAQHADEHSESLKSEKNKKADSAGGNANATVENEHLDQSDVDSLLSGLGF